MATTPHVKYSIIVVNLVLLVTKALNNQFSFTSLFLVM